jgi:hypothetical protein
MQHGHDKQYGHVANACSMNIQQRHEAFTSSIDKQHGYAAGTCSVDIQHGHPGLNFKVIQHGHAERTWHAAWTWACSTNIQHGHVACTCCMDMHHRHAAG